jgi:NAD(P)-dependent dehydrogenase (short-subunit alcohol dehydrogenase family)
MRLAGKTAIVTGAGTGIGLAVAKRFAAEGARVVIADIKGHQDSAAAITSQGGTAIGIETDISSEESVNGMVQEALRQFETIDILVNNAAISAGLRLGPFEKQQVSDWRRILDVNVIGTFNCCRAVSSHMRSRKSGRIINLTSGMAFKGTPLLMHYVASKGAIISMTRALANELGADNILVNAVAPGYVLSEGNLQQKEFFEAVRAPSIAGRAIKRDEMPEDVVGPILFLASEDAGFVSGQILAVDGGSVYH